MQLQPTGAAPAQQVQAVKALANIQNATQAAEDRVNRAFDETLGSTKEALKLSEANNVILADRLSAAIERIESLAKRVEELEVLRRIEKVAYDERINALEMRLKANEETTKTLRANLDSAKTNFAGHVHRDGYTGSNHITTSTGSTLF